MDQMRLVADVFQLLDSYGYERLNDRQMNAVISAANLICDEFRKPHVDATDGMGLEAWLKSDDIGLSSLAMAWHMAHEPWMKTLIGPKIRPEARDSHPWDPSDFGRCYRFLKAVPAAIDKLDRMRSVSPVWERMVENWDRMTELYERDVESGRSDELYELMQNLIDGRTNEK